MGFQLRRRTKGKNSWFNYSYSKRNGLRGSLSFKIGKDWTVNLGRNGTRTTVNLGNGLRYVSPQRKLFGSDSKKQTTPKASTKKTSSAKPYVAREEDAHIPIDQIPSSCKMLGDVLTEHAEHVNEDDKLILFAVREAMTVHVEKGINENDRGTLNLIQECYDEIRKLKAKSDNDGHIELYDKILKVIVYIKRGYDYGVYSITPEKEQEFKITWSMVIIIAIICFVIQMAMR